MEFIVKRKSSSDSELKHYGIKGQTWGVRRYQNEDGSYTSAGKKRYSENRGSSNRSAVPKTRALTKNVSRASQKQLTNEQLAAITAKKLSDEQLAELTAQSQQNKLIEDQVKEELARKLKDKGITVDPSKVSKEYLMEMASNSGIDISAVSRIEDFLKSDNKPVQVSGESLSKGIDYDQLQKNMNDALSRQDELMGQFKKEQEEAEKKVAEGIAKTREMTPSNVSPEYLKEKEYNSKKNVYFEEPPITGESLSKGIDYDQLQKNVNDALSRQDKQMGQVSTEYQKEKVNNELATNNPAMKKQVLPDGSLGDWEDKYKTWDQVEKELGLLRNVKNKIAETEAASADTSSKNTKSAITKPVDEVRRRSELAQYEEDKQHPQKAMARKEALDTIKREKATKEAVDATIARQLENAKAKQERKETSRRSKTSEGSSRKSMMQSDRNVFYISRDGDPELQHYGILGMKWGVRRYQNSDGSLTSAGRKRYRDDAKFDNREIRDMANKAAIVGNAARIADKKVARAEKRNKGERTIESLKKTQKALHEQYDVLDKDLREAHDRAKEKYGEKAVGDLQYRKNGYAKGSGWYNSLNNWEIGARYNTMSMDNSSLNRTVRNFITGNYQERYNNFTSKWNERGSGAEAARSLINSNLSESIRSLYDQRTRNAAYYSYT